MSDSLSAPYKVFGVLTIVFSALLIPTMVLAVLELIPYTQEPDFSDLVTGQTLGLIIALPMTTLLLSYYNRYRR